MNLNGLEIRIIRSTRKKTMHIVIERDGSVSAQVPESIDDDKILAILKTKEYEIHKKLTYRRELNNQQIERQYLSGQSFMYLGKNYNLQIVDGQKKGLILKEGKFLLNSKIENPREAFIKFYKQHCEHKLKERIKLFEGVVKILPTSLSIRELPTRWASCTPDKKIYFNWRCIMAPLPVFDYLIVHELVHLEFPNHSRQFWDKVSLICPEYEAHERWLKRNGIRMTL